MIEVQVITSSQDNQDWYQKCLTGLQSPVVNIHYGELVEGNTSAARMAVWDACGGDLLSFADPDDIPVANAWQKLQDALDANPKAMGAYTLEQIIGDDGSPRGKPINNQYLDATHSVLVVHHLLVVRRPLYELIRPYLQTINSGCEWFLAIAALKKGGLIKIPEVGYYWRRHDVPGMFAGPDPNGKIRNLASKLDTTMKQRDDFIKWLDAQSSL